MQSQAPRCGGCSAWRSAGARLARQRSRIHRRYVASSSAARGSASACSACASGTASARSRPGSRRSASSCATRVEDAVAAFGCGRPPQRRAKGRRQARAGARTGFSHSLLLGNTVGGPGAEKPQGARAATFLRAQASSGCLQTVRTCYARTTVPAYKSPAPRHEDGGLRRAEPRERAAGGRQGETGQSRSVADRATAEARDGDPDQRERAGGVAGDREHPGREEREVLLRLRDRRARRAVPRAARPARRPAASPA